MDTVEAQKSLVTSFLKKQNNAPLLSMSESQEYSRRERRSDRSTIVSRVTIPLDIQEGDQLCEAIWDVFIAKKEGGEILERPTACASYTGEWIGYRQPGRQDEESKVECSEEDKFNAINAHACSDFTIFYLNGGAWCLPGIPGMRPMIRQLCTHSGARAFIIQPRLAPQETIPSILLDVFVGYLYLIAPPPGSMHQPINPQKIVFAGESSGAVLHLGIIQLIQHWTRHSTLRNSNSIPNFYRNNHPVPISMPSGLTLLSPAVDLTFSLPSASTLTDWMAYPPIWLRPTYPCDSIWPSTPPRSLMFCDPSAILHPLIQPSSNLDWTGAPPVWLACGQESQTDGIKFLARNLLESGVQTTLVEYEGMPHCWAMMVWQLPQSRDYVQKWGEICRRFGGGGGGAKGDRVKTRNNQYWFVKMGALEMVKRDERKLLDLSTNEVFRRMKSERDNKFVRYVWNGRMTEVSKL